MIGRYLYRRKNAYYVCYLMWNYSFEKCFSESADPSPEVTATEGKL